MSKPTIFPTVHMNGTSAKMLLEGYEEAYRAVIAARDSFSKIEFNARDYYVQGPEAWTKAQEELRAHMLKVADAGDYLLAVIFNIQDQQTEIERMKRHD